MIKRSIFITGSLLAALLLAGCDSGDGPAENAGEQVDEAAEEAGEAAEEAAETAGDAADEAADKVEEATE